MSKVSALQDRVIEEAKKRRARALELYDEKDGDGKRKRTMADVAELLGVTKQRASELVARARREQQVPRGTRVAA